MDYKLLVGAVAIMREHMRFKEDLVEIRTRLQVHPRKFDLHVDNG
jgi:hypothetical protein